MAVRLTRAEATAQTREQLLEAAERVFLERGFHAASLDAVAESGASSKPVTEVVAGFGLAGGGTGDSNGGTVKLAVDSNAIQRRIANACAAGSSIRAVAADGSVTCEADDNTTYSAG